MQYILLFMVLLILFIIIKNVKSSFVGVKKYQEKVVEFRNKISHDYEVHSGVAILFSIIFGVFLSIFYILSSIYVGNFIFVVISILLIFMAWNAIFKGLNDMLYKEINNIKKHWFNNVMSIVELCYCVYVFYFLMITW